MADYDFNIGRGRPLVPETVGRPVEIAPQARTPSLNEALSPGLPQARTPYHAQDGQVASVPLASTMAPSRLTDMLAAAAADARGQGRVPDSLELTRQQAVAKVEGSAGFSQLSAADQQLVRELAQGGGRTGSDLSDIVRANLHSPLFGGMDAATGVRLFSRWASEARTLRFEKSLERGEPLAVARLEARPEFDDPATADAVWHFISVLKSTPTPHMDDWRFNALSLANDFAQRAPGDTEDLMSQVRQQPALFGQARRTMPAQELFDTDPRVRSLSPERHAALQRLVSEPGPAHTPTAMVLHQMLLGEDVGYHPNYSDLSSLADYAIKAHGGS